MTAPTVNLEHRFPRPGENQTLRRQLIGCVNGVHIRVPFATDAEAKRYAWERGWRVLTGLTLRD